MYSRFIKIGSLSLLLLGLLALSLEVHDYDAHQNVRQAISQKENWEAAKQGSPTFFHTNPFGMPGADSVVNSPSDMNSYAAAYGLTPPTSLKSFSVNVSDADLVSAKPPSKWNYLGLLGLLGILGFTKHSHAN
ncbi:hypothetical protein [Paenibacillus sp. N3.4]|uniref:hypothetical protein n=1 Tax=Paenibacillus sp. N3.4 TaxID=2603222 RepID=UPI0011CC3F97|nr:hypothetical protein [Paenibacillus sp. N3.4]TXK76101.1 hypothetical protein FU659_26255 [Paenibacillus sp. N3.4]